MKNYNQILANLQADDNLSIEEYNKSLSEAIDLLLVPEFCTELERIEIAKSLILLKFTLNDFTK